MNKNSKIWIGLLGLLLVISIVFAVIVANPAGGLRSTSSYTIATPTQSLSVDTGVVNITTGATANTTLQYSKTIVSLTSLLPIFFVVMIVAYVFEGLESLGGKE